MGFWNVVETMMVVIQYEKRNKTGSNAVAEFLLLLLYEPTHSIKQLVSTGLE